MKPEPGSDPVMGNASSYLSNLPPEWALNEAVGLDLKDVRCWVEGSRFNNWKNPPIFILTGHDLWFLKKGFRRDSPRNVPLSQVDEVHYSPGKIRGELVVIMAGADDLPMRAKIGRGGRPDAAVLVALLRNPTSTARDLIRQLTELRNQELISNEVFEKKKKELLDHM